MRQLLKWLTDGRRPQLAAPRGLTPISEFSEQDIFIAGYPKSGNTWFQDLISAVVYGVSPELCPPKLPQELVPDVHYRQFYQRYQTPTFFKTHHLPRPEYKRVVYLLRDGRDVMVSYFHHTAALEGKAPNFEQMVTTKALFPCSWREHVTAWMANRFKASMMVIKYEDLKRDAAGEMIRFCEFAGIQRDRAFVERMAAATAFEKMQSREARYKVYLNPQWPRDKLFRRRGQVGSFRDEMPLEVLKAFTTRSGDVLRECGYT